MAKVLIIGAGIAGIATVIRLAMKGYEVEIFEANNYPGGKLSEIKQDGFRFDAGPSLFTMPQYVNELFELAGKDSSQFFSYRELDTICKYFYYDGSLLTAYSDEEKFIAEVNELSGEGESMRGHLKNSSEIYKISAPVFLKRSYSN